MEHQLWKAIVAVLATFSKGPKRRNSSFEDQDIVKVYYWAVIHDRPVAWACRHEHWPIHLRRWPLPSPTTMSRRLRSASVVALLNALEHRIVAPTKPALFWMIDGKPLAISGCSKDRQAGYGRAASCKAKGYKMHAIVSSEGAIASWRIAPMNKDERVMAERMLQTAPIQGYLVADANYDSNKLHEICCKREQLQLVTPRRYGPGQGTGHRKQSPGRLRSIQLTENPYPEFARQLLNDREEIERRFAQLTNWGGGLTCLPPWVRTHRRVHRWVQAKLVLSNVKRSERHQDLRRLMQ
jgi:Transposase DDE domain